MAAAAPPIIPVSTAQLPPPSDTNVAPAAAANPSSAFRSFVLRISDSSRLALAQRRSWAELLDRSSFARPTSLSEATSRLRKNLPYYRINYLIVVASVLALSLVFHPGSLLLLLILAAAWIFLYLFRPSDAPPISLFGRTFSDREIFGGLIALTIFVVFLTTVGSLIISAIMLGAALVAVHGSFHLPDDLFLDDQEPGANVGFLSFLGGIVPPASAAQAVVAGR
ncbi:PRA1 protein B3 [Asimina triloba]